MNFDASIHDIFDVAGNRIDPQLGRGVYREDNGELLSICGPHTKLIQHKDVVMPVVQKLEEMGYDLEEGTPSEHALYNLQGKKGAFISSQVTDNGAVMRTNIILGDFIEPTGSTAYMEQGADTNFFRISLLNSHNSKLAVRANTDYLRILCMNGMTSPNFSAAAYGKHTLNFNLDGLKAQIANAISMMDKDADRFGLMASTKLTLKQAEQFLQLTIAKLPNKANGDAHFSEPLVNKLLSNFAREDQTLWGLFNAVTAWSTHGDMKANADDLTGRIGREGQVAKMIKTKKFSELLAA